MRVSSRYFDAANIDPRLRAGLVGHWIGGGSGLTWMDRSGYQNHGTLTSGPTWGLGFGGKRDALFFDGVDDYVNAGSMAMLDAAPAATLAYWGYRSATNKTITINKHINNNNWLELSHRSDGNIYGITANGGVYYKVIGLSVTGWHHYCLVFDGGLVGNARVALYVDGSALAGGSVAGGQAGFAVFDEFGDRAPSPGFGQLGQGQQRQA